MCLSYQARNRTAKQLGTLKFKTPNVSQIRELDVLNLSKLPMFFIITNRALPFQLWNSDSEFWIWNQTLNFRAFDVQNIWISDSETSNDLNPLKHLFEKFSSQIIRDPSLPLNTFSENDSRMSLVHEPECSGLNLGEYVAFHYHCAFVVLNQKIINLPLLESKSVILVAAGRVALEMAFRRSIFAWKLLYT